MKYKVIATAVVLVILLAVLALRGCGESESLVDEYGNPVYVEQIQ